MSKFIYYPIRKLHGQAEFLGFLSFLRNPARPIRKRIGASGEAMGQTDDSLFATPVRIGGDAKLESPSSNPCTNIVTWPFATVSLPSWGIWETFVEAGRYDFDLNYLPNIVLRQSYRDVFGYGYMLGLPKAKNFVVNPFIVEALKKLDSSYACAFSTCNRSRGFLNVIYSGNTQLVGGRRWRWGGGFSIVINEHANPLTWSMFMKIPYAAENNNIIREPEGLLRYRLQSHGEAPRIQTDVSAFWDDVQGIEVLGPRTDGIFRQFDGKINIKNIFPIVSKMFDIVHRPQTLPGFPRNPGPRSPWFYQNTVGNYDENQGEPSFRMLQDMGEVRITAGNTQPDDIALPEEVEIAVPTWFAMSLPVASLYYFELAEFGKPTPDFFWNTTFRWSEIGVKGQRTTELYQRNQIGRQSDFTGLFISDKNPEGIHAGGPATDNIPAIAIINRRLDPV